MVYEEGSFTQRHVYDPNGKRISTELTHAQDTQRGAPGENIASDTAVSLNKVWYRTSHLDSTLFAVDKNGDVLTHTLYDPWGNPQNDTHTDLNFTGLDNRNNYTGYTWDVTLELYFAQARFYDAKTHRFTQEDPVKDGGNWYVYVGNEPQLYVDWAGLFSVINNAHESSGMSENTYTRIVATAQKWLVEMKYLDMGAAKHGTFGGLTIGAVAHFQFNYGLDITGVLDSKTYLNIYNSYLRNVKGYDVETAKQLYDAEKKRVMAIDVSFRVDGYYPPYNCYFFQAPKLDYPTIKGVPIVEKSGKYYMDFTQYIDSHLNANEPDFKVKTYEEYMNQFTWLAQLLGGVNYSEYYQSKMIWFASQVMEKGPWDLKSKDSWDNMFNGAPPYYAQKFPFIYRGEIINSENLGNITYGYLGTSMGYSEKTLTSAGDLVSWLTGSGKEGPEDIEMVKRGIKYYESK